MSQDNDTITRFNKRVDAQLGKDLIEPELPPIQRLGRAEFEPIRTTEEVTPVELDLSLDPKETQQAIKQVEAMNILNRILADPKAYTPHTMAVMAISALILKLSGCF